MHPALAYAENVLGVHQVYEEANALLAEHDDMLSRLDSAVDRRRYLDDQIADREMDILIEERGKAPDISQAAMDRRLKEVQHKDESLRKLRTERNAVAAEASGLELDIDHMKYRLKVKVARIEQLGGMLNYLAAVKNAEPPPVLYAEASTSGQPAMTGGETSETNTTGVSQ